jgi:hypothetical protein
MNVELLMLAAARTFEELCFLQAERTNGEVQPSPTRGARVRFRGPFTGELTVRLPPAALREAAENMLGDPDVSDTATDDVLREITNVVCGHALPMIAGADAVFDISAPFLVDPSSTSEDGTTAEMAVGGQRATVGIRVSSTGATS